MTYDITEKRVLIKDSIRTLCCQRNYCTKCDNDQYSDMLNICDQDTPINLQVITIASLIMNYSDSKYIKIIYGVSDLEWLESICHDLYNQCAVSFVKVIEKP